MDKYRAVTVTIPVEESVIVSVSSIKECNVCLPNVDNKTITITNIPTITITIIEE